MLVSCVTTIFILVNHLKEDKNGFTINLSKAKWWDNPKITQSQKSLNTLYTQLFTSLAPGPGSFANQFIVSNYSILQNKLTCQVSSSITSSVSSVTLLLTESDNRKKRQRFHLPQSPFIIGTATKPGFCFLLFKIIYGKHQIRKIAIQILHLILSPLSTLGKKRFLQQPWAPSNSSLMAPRAFPLAKIKVTHRWQSSSATYI